MSKFIILHSKPAFQIEMTETKLKDLYVQYAATKKVFTKWNMLL